MFRAAYHSSSGALNCICNLWFTYCNKVKDFVYIIHSPYIWTMYMDYHQELQNVFAASGLYTKIR